MARQSTLFRTERFASEIPDPCLVLQLPYPPSVNHYWVYFATGKRVACTIGKPGRLYREVIANWVFLAGVKQPLAGRLSVELLCTMPDNIRRDVDNVAKALLDALQHAGVWADDNQIDRLVIARAGVEAPGGVEVRVAQL